MTAVLGVGGRDLSAAVGGRSTLAAMQVLDDHQGTNSWSSCRSHRTRRSPSGYVPGRWLKTPSLVAFVGRGQEDLAAATARILLALGRTPTPPPQWPAPYDRAPRAGFVRGLFSGGTLCDEAMAIAAESLGPISSNTPLEGSWVLGPDLRSPGHLMIDFGDDA